MTELDSLERALRDPATQADHQPPELARAAAAAGLLDVAYATFDSPVGTLLLAATPTGLVRVAYLDAGDEDAVLEDLAARVSPRVLAAPRTLDEPRRELDEYFAGRRNTFEMALDWQLTGGFGRRVLQATARIPYGSVSTYKDVAAQAGSPADHEPPGTRWAQTRCRSSSPAIGSCTAVVGSAATPAGLGASGCCSRWRLARVRSA